MEHIPYCDEQNLPHDARKLMEQLPKLNFNRVMGNLPNAFNPMIEAIRSIYSLDFDKKKKEILILRVGFSAQSPYEMHQHSQVALASGLTQETIDIITQEDVVTSLDEESNFLCKVADELEKRAHLSDATFAQLNELYTQEEATAIILIVSFYAMISRFLNGARIPIESTPQFEGQTDPFDL